MGDASRPDDGRRLLGSLLERDDLDDASWLALARERRDLSGYPVFSELVRLLSHVRMSEGESEELWPMLLAHRAELAERLGRDPGLRIAVFDWLVNIQPRVKEPTLVEQSVLDRTERSAMTDWLTGLYNRGAFRASALRELRRAQRYRQRLSLLLFDLDDFKAVNDRYGHERGDLVLRETSRLVSRLVRDVDIAGRYGGEEFAVLLPETGREGAAAVAERIRAAVSQQSWVRGSLEDPIRMTVSGGVAVYPEDGGELGDLFRQADAALYRAKANGKDRIIWEYMERRQSRRHPLAGIRMRVSVRMPRDGRLLEATAREMSRTGLGLTVPERFEVGERIELALEGVGSEGPLALEGRVVHHVERQGDDGVPAFDLGVGLDERSYPAAAAAIETIFSGKPGADGPGSADRSPNH